MEYDFLTDTYATERLKTLSVWAMFKDEDLTIRPQPLDRTDRNLLEYMVHQCMSEYKWFNSMFAMDVGTSPLPEKETRLDFIKKYAEDSGKRLVLLREKDRIWWEQVVSFFETQRPRTWIMLRRIAHTAHHRGEQTVLLRVLGREVYSVYGPSAFSGGLPQNDAVTAYPYRDVAALIQGETVGRGKTPLPGPGNKPVTERPEP